MTCREKLMIEHPDKICEVFYGGCIGCPNFYGYLPVPFYCPDDEVGNRETCTKCWDREIPENKENDERTENEMNETTTRTMTREELYEEINQKRAEINSLKQKIEKLAKYEKYDAAAAECAALRDSYIRAGFTEEQAFEIVLICIKANFKI